MLIINKLVNYDTFSFQFNVIRTVIEILFSTYPQLFFK